MITEHHVHLRDAHKTRQFWLIWLVLCLNVSAGIGVIGMASPMLQEIFAGHLIGQPDLELHPARHRAEGRHRRHRRRLRRASVAVQHRRAAGLGLGLGPVREEEHLFHLLRAGHCALHAGAQRSRIPATRCCSWR
ncbi:MAG: hypothetical protein Q4615_02670 [Paracoccus aminovorans]|nr:hypothetical protein [Paracoccus aminovorans]